MTMMIMMMMLLLFRSDSAALPPPKKTSHNLCTSLRGFQLKLLEYVDAELTMIVQIVLSFGAFSNLSSLGPGEG
jgi:hypothetical protein